MAASGSSLTPRTSSHKLHKLAFDIHSSTFKRAGKIAHNATSLYEEHDCSMKCCNTMRHTLIRGPWLVQQQTRPFSMERVVKGLHDGIRVAAGLGETLVGRPLGLPRLAGPRYKVKTSPISWHIGPPTPPTADLNAPNPPPERLRSVMRLLPQGVVVCTSTHDGAPRGMTMSSFASLTLKPVPVVTFNVATPSRTLDAIQASRCFNIHVLSGDAHGAAVADHFTRGNTADVFASLEETTLQDGEGAPVLQGEGVVYVLKCRVMDDAPSEGLMKVRDHVIVAGEVVDMVKGNEARDFALAYADRKYRQVGSVIIRS